MKVGVLQFFSWPGRKGDLKDVYDRGTQRVKIMDHSGYDCVWIAEHHFSNTYGILPDPFSYLAYLAAKTTRIKLGAAVMVVPLHHPMRIVENAAFIDILSDGRFQLGLGSGYRPYEFEGLGMSYEQRREIQQEAIPLILQGFHDKRVNADGKHFKFKMDEQYEIFPHPIQKPHPPFFMGAGTDESMQFAAEHGFGLMQSTLPPLEVIGEHIQHYRKHMKSAPAPLNQNPAFGRVDVVRMVYVAPTDALAREQSEAGITHHMKAFGQAGSYLGDVTGGAKEDQLSYDYLAENTILHGSPETVIRKIEAFRDIGATSIMVHYPPYYGLEQTLDMLRLFAKGVLPHLREMKTAAG